MYVKNLTPEPQKIEVKEILEDQKIYEMYLMPHCTIELDRSMVVERPERYTGIIMIEGIASVPQTCASCSIVDLADSMDESKSEDDPQESEDTQPEQTQPVQEDSLFICDICGAEYGSARGLASHKSRVHADN